MNQWVIWKMEIELFVMFHISNPPCDYYFIEKLQKELKYLCDTNGHSFRSRNRARTDVRAGFLWPGPGSRFGRFSGDPKANGLERLRSSARAYA